MMLTPSPIHYSAGRKVFLLLPLLLVFMAVDLWSITVNAFHFMVRDGEPFSLARLFWDAWSQFSLAGFFHGLANAQFWLFKSAVLLSCIFWWRKPSKWRYAFPAALVLFACACILLETWSWYNHALSGYAEYKKRIPFWFPLSPFTFR